MTDAYRHRVDQTANPSPKVGVLTGGSRGIGASTAILLAQQGWDLCISYRSDADAASAVVAACQAEGRRAVAACADISVEADVIELFERATAELGPLSLLVNNAGIVGDRSRLEDMPADRIAAMFTVNSVGPIVCAREAVRRMSTDRGGHGGAIVNVSSAASRIGSPEEYVDYAASKGAIDTFTLGLSKEVAAVGIRVNAVRPGIVDTEIHASGGQPTKAVDAASRIPLGRAGQPGEVAAAIAWLASDAASYVTGAVLDVSGGR
jgi:NAD(P)-dependent dehydrogenase (short-subunit alcohol dehydrogenase family)